MDMYAGTKVAGTREDKPIAATEGDESCWVSWGIQIASLLFYCWESKSLVDSNPPSK